MNSIEATLDSIRSYGDGQNRSTPNGTDLIQHVPHVAPLAYLHSVFPPLSESAVDELNEAVGGVLSADYREFLLKANGLTVFTSALSLYGIRYNASKGIEAAQQQPYDLYSANSWRYADLVPDGDCIVGGFNWDSSRIVTRRSDRTIRRCDNTDFRVLNTWPSLNELLVTEFARLAARHDESGRLIDSETPTTPESSVGS